MTLNEMHPISQALLIAGAATILALPALGDPRAKHQQARPVATTRIVQTYGKLPLSFEANRGQTNQDVRFLSRGRGYTLFLTCDGSALSLKHGADSGVVRTRLLGASPKAAVSGSGRLPGTSNYFIGNDPARWRTGIPSYGRVRYAGVYPGVDLTRYGASAGDLSISDSLGIPRNARVVGIVANLRRVKDLPLFLRAARIVSLEVPDAVFLLVGRGQLRAELSRLATELGIRDKVYFSGERGDVPDYLARIAIGCLTSESEGLPNAILEYMAAGLPVVATDVGGISELVDHGRTGFLVRERSAEAVAAPIIRLLRDEGLRATMGQAGLNRAQADFEISVAVKRLEEFYINALACREDS